MSDDDLLPVIQRIEVLGLRPDDVVLLMTKHQLHPDVIKRIQEQWRQGVQLPNRVMILEEGLEVKVMRPDKAKRIEQAEKNRRDLL